MGKFTYAHNNFTAGQLSQRLQGRIDLKEYVNGCEELENGIPFKQGGVIRRPGTGLFKHPLADATADFDNANMLLIPFVYSKTVSYIFVVDVENSKVRAYTTAGVDVTLSGVVTGTWSFTATLDPYGFDWVQTGYYLILTHNSGTMAPKLISPTFGATGALTNLTLGLFNDGYAHKIPYLEVNTSLITLQNASTSAGADTLTASASFFNSSHVGSYFMLKHGNQWGITYVSSITSATIAVTVNVITFGATTATDTWRESAWSPRQGYPKCVTMYEGRAVFGGTLRKPDTIWFSMTNNINFMLNQRLGVSPGAGYPPYIKTYIGDTVATDPFDLTIAGDQANVIAWLIPGRSLHAGTIGEEYIISFNGNAVSADFANDGIPTVRPITAYGSAPIKPVKLSDMSVFITRDGKNLRSLIYLEENGSFVSNDLNVLSDDIIYHNAVATASYMQIQFKQIAFHSSRNIVWAITSTNELVGLTLSDDGKVFAWHKHTIGGKSTASVTHAKVISIAVAPNSNGAWDDLYLLVKRYINSATVYYLERLRVDFLGDETNSSIEYPVHLDCSLGQPVPADTTLPNLTKYIGESVSVVMDGEYEGEFTVNGSGEITLPSIPVNHVYVGYKYTTTIKTMDLEAGGDFGVSMGLVKRIDRAFIKFHKTREAKIGTSSTNSLPVNFTSTTVLFTGDKKLVINNSPGEPGNIIITQDQPYPMTVLAVAIRGVTYD